MEKDTEKGLGVPVAEPTVEIAAGPVQFGLAVSVCWPQFFSLQAFR